MALTTNEQLQARRKLLQGLQSQIKESELRRITPKNPFSPEPQKAPERENGSPLLELSSLYVEAAHDQHNIKPSVRAATTENIKLNGTQVIDGVSVKPGDRVLVKDQTSPAQNGIYVASAENWARSLDANDEQKLSGGAFTVVEEGNVNRMAPYFSVTPLNYTMGRGPVRWTLYKERKTNAGAVRGVVPNNDTGTDASSLYGVGDGGRFTGTVSPS